MGQRRGAARREKRLAKRMLARAERGSQKYANQKGGIKKSGKRIARRPYIQEDDEKMIVVRGGEPTVVGGAFPDGTAPARGATTNQPSADAEDGASEEDLVTSLQKKVRAIEKKLRSLEPLKQKLRKGIELDPQQQVKLRHESLLRQELEQFQAELDEEMKEAGEEEEDEDGVEDDDDDDEEEEDRAGGGDLDVTSPARGSGARRAKRRLEKSAAEGAGAASAAPKPKRPSATAECAASDAAVAASQLSRLAAKRLEKKQRHLLQLAEKREKKKQEEDEKEAKRQARREKASR
uniref:Uncharacterized protein n=1 Tax=Chrysotila carterae TaxID=13221 RepID=A0A7S4EXB1_CHRCT|mmetsp:Transcript_26547/g.55778  ORF Transcript_26547/g.55778 Transcript_26547/m.55778 type:complete len:293 (-) Transcript_26547:677-1555(-)